LSVPIEGYFRLCNRLILSVPVEGYFRLCNRLILSVPVEGYFSLNSSCTQKLNDCKV
jgi:hypothetical protein